LTRLREVSIEPVEMDPLELGEGARWFPDGPVQVDLLTGRFFGHRPGGFELLLDLGVPLGAAALRAGGGLVLVAGTGVRLLAGVDDPNPVVIDTGADSAVLRVNDASTDDHGRLWFGLMPYDSAVGAGSLWRLDPDVTLTRVLSEITIPNGPVIDSERGLLYLADSARGEISRHTVDLQSGALGPAEPFVVVSDASPDGMALDAEGGLWSALWGGSRLHRYGPDGQLTDVVPLPVRQPTSLALDPDGGPALVTSARHGLADPAALDGRSLWVELGATAPPTRPFGASNR
jgi:sugar lactone lactonase YvrE